jgi:hypothetical protein
VCAWLAAASALAHTPEPATRTDVIAAEQAEKAKDLHPYVGNRAERVVNGLEEALIGGRIRVHPYFIGLW